MPTYQYACTNPETKHEFEVVQSFTDPAVTVCPECDAGVRKVYGSVGVVFKGSGFYRNDSRSKTSAEDSTKGAGSSDSSSSKESPSKETSSKESASKGSASKESAKKDAPKKESASSNRSSSNGGSASGGSSSGGSGKAAQ